LLWTISGVFFSFNKIEEVRGEQYLLESKEKDFSINSPININSSGGIKFFYRLDDLVYEVNLGGSFYVYHQDGNPIAKLSFSEAKEIIQTKTNLTPISVGEISKNERGSEYRSRPLPLFKVESLNKDEKVINVYLDPYSGQIRAIRSTQWRMWDFLWGLHIMDWTDRDNFNNNFIKFFSVLAFISALSGILLFFKTRRT
tara:strand:- start:12621 stop:13217 length:597 start_codon:yes stop_codon:yes gene_type:complete